MFGGLPHAGFSVKPFEIMGTNYTRKSIKFFATTSIVESCHVLSTISSHTRLALVGQFYTISISGQDNVYVDDVCASVTDIEEFEPTSTVSETTTATEFVDDCMSADVVGLRFEDMVCVHAVISLYHTHDILSLCQMDKKRSTQILPDKDGRRKPQHPSLTCVDCSSYSTRFSHVSLGQPIFWSAY